MCTVISVDCLAGVEQVFKGFLFVLLHLLIVYLYYGLGDLTMIIMERECTVISVDCLGHIEQVSNLVLSHVQPFQQQTMQNYQNINRS